MRIRVLTFIFFVSLFVTAVSAKADSMVQMQLLNVGPGNYDPSLSNFYVYPYNFSVNGVLMSMLCDDFNDDISIGESWKANVYTLSDILAGKGQMNPLASDPGSSGSLAVLNGQTRTQAYEEAAWLYEQLYDDPTSQNAVGINHTVWALFSTTPFYNNPTVQYWYDLSVQATSGLTDAQAESMFGDIEFFTPIVGTQSEGGRPQEFIGVVTPEPSTVTLVFTGLLGLVVVGRRKRADKMV